VNWERYSAWSGLGGVVVFVVGAFVAPLPPSAGDPADLVAGYYHEHLGALRGQLLLTGLAGILLLWFFGSLAAHLRRAEGEGGRLTSVALGGWLIGTALVGLGTVAEGLLVLEVARAPAAVPVPFPGRPPGQFLGISIVVRILADFRWMAYTLSWFAFAPALVAVAVLAYRHAAFPRWHANLGYVLFFVAVAAGVGIVFSSGPWAPGGALDTITMLAFLVWLGLTSALVAGWSPSATRPTISPGPPPAI
jgi:hypothetical protein